MTATLHRHRDEFAERNPFLLVLLGLISCSQAVESTLTRLTDGVPLAGERAPVVDEEPTLLLVLGLASIASTVLGHAEAARATIATTGTANAAAGSVDLRRLLE